MMGERPPLAMTMGDPAGIGPELALAAWRQRAAADAPFFVLSSPARLAETAQRLGWAAPIVETDPENAASVIDRGLPVAPLGNPVVSASLGVPSAANAAGDARIDRARGHGSAGRNGARGRHQSDRQGDALSGRISLSGPHRISGRARLRLGRARAPGDDDLVRGAGGRAGHHSYRALGSAPRADPGADRRDGAGGRPRSQDAVSPRPASPRRRGPQSPRRGGRRDGARGDHHHRAGDRGVARRRDRRVRPASRRHDVPRRRRARVTTSR